MLLVFSWPLWPVSLCVLSVRIPLARPLPAHVLSPAWSCGCPRGRTRLMAQNIVFCISILCVWECLVGRLHGCSVASLSHRRTRGAIVCSLCFASQRSTPQPERVWQGRACPKLGAARTKHFLFTPHSWMQQPASISPLLPAAHAVCIRGLALEHCPTSAFNPSTSVGELNTAKVCNHC